MSAIITGVLKLTFGVLFDKLRDTTADKLKEGDLTDEKCRQLIVRELDDIKSKLDALIRKDLLSSIEFFRDGMNYLAMALQHSGSVQHKQENMSVEGASSLGISVAEGQLNIVSEERFTMAKKKFETAGEEATRAFSNPALSTEDKILATKFRIMSSILQGIHDVEAAVKAAVMYLERLHDLPAIQEAFAVYLDGGFKSVFGKAKRLEIVQDVSVINFELFYFARTVAKTSVDLFAWPKIKLATYEYQPILPGPRIPLVMGPFHIPLTDVEITPSCFAINSKGDILFPVDKGTIFIFFAKPASSPDKHETFWSFSKEDQEKPEFMINCMTIDADDNLYVITFHKYHLEVYSLYTIDSKGTLKHQCLLNFLSECPWSFFKMNATAVNKLGQIVMGKVLDDKIYTFDNKGQLHGMFNKCGNSGKSSLSTVYLTCSDTNEIIMALYDENSVHVYTAAGKYNRTFFPPYGHSLAGVAFNHIAKSIILLTRFADKRKSTIKMCLWSYAPDTDKPQMVQLPGTVSQNCHITSHVNGPVAVFTESGAIFI